MKIKSFCLAICLLAGPTLAVEIEPSWQDIDSSCFELVSSFRPETELSSKIKFTSPGEVFFVQNEKLLPFRIFNYGSKKYFDYKVLSATGLMENSKLENLNDNNYQSTVEFDPYYKGQKEILLDFQEIIAGGIYGLYIDFYADKLYPRIFLSQDNINFVEVRNVDDIDFRYLKIYFDDFDKKDSTSKKLLIGDILLGYLENSTYLVNPQSSESDVMVLAKYNCQKDNIFYRLLDNYLQDGQKAEFSIDKDSPEFILEFVASEQYDKDFDDDGVLNHEDNCPFLSNTDQVDLDKDLLGDACDFDVSHKNPLEKDSDSDGVGDDLDNCPYIFNPRQLDSNADGRGDPCADDDGDSIIGQKDNCPKVENRDQKDININGIGDACEFDKDEDGVFDSLDNCINEPNLEQDDDDGDGIGNICDNCELYNPQQTDKNQDGKGDRCEEEEEWQKKNDKDSDGILDAMDNCPKIANPKILIGDKKMQPDEDSDGVGDACDNCPKLQNPRQEDKDKNQLGDLCEDGDQDGFEGYLDNCLYHHNPEQKDSNNDGTGDACKDDDRDDHVAAEDNCPFDHNPKQIDADNDGTGDQCDDQDNRFIESNRYFIISFVVLVIMLFGATIWIMIKKIKKANNV